jgi:hypothetical protein
VNQYTFEKLKVVTYFWLLVMKAREGFIRSIAGGLKRTDWLLVNGYWLLVIGYWVLISGHGPFISTLCFPASAVGYRWLAAG